MSKTKNTVKTGISIDSDLLARCDASIPLTNAQSRSELVSCAIAYYIVYLFWKEGHRFPPAQKPRILLFFKIAHTGF